MPAVGRTRWNAFEDSTNLQNRPARIDAVILGSMPYFIARAEGVLELQ